MLGMTVNIDKIRLWGRMGVVTSTAMDTDSVIIVRRTQFGHLMNSVAAQRDLQDDLDIPRWQATLPDSSHYH